jgi:hypothetical protein
LLVRRDNLRDDVVQKIIDIVRAKGVPNREFSTDTETAYEFPLGSNVPTPSVQYQGNGQGGEPVFVVRIISRPWSSRLCFVVQHDPDFDETKETEALGYSVDSLFEVLTCLVLQ